MSITIISSGEVVTSSILGAEDEQYVYFGGTANITIINSSGQQYVSSGGTANSTTINAGGVQDIYLGGEADYTILNGGLQNIFDGGSASGTVLNTGGIQSVFSGGSANDTIISSGGTQTVSSGGAASGATVYSGGYVFVSGGGIVDNTTVSTGGYITVFSGGTANNNTISSGGYMRVMEETSVSGIIQEDGAAFLGDTFATVLNGSNANGTFYISNGIASNIIGKVDVRSTNTAIDTTVLRGMTVGSFGNVIRTTINSGGSLFLFGATTDTSINSGGIMVISSGGQVAGELNVDGGQVVASEQTVMSGSDDGINLLGNADLSSATFILAGGGDVVVQGENNEAGNISISDGGALIFDISGLTLPNENAMLNNLYDITTSTINLTIDSSTNTLGSYELAGGIELPASVSINVYDSGTSIGELTLANALAVDDFYCTLSVSDGSLFFNIAEDGLPILTETSKLLASDGTEGKMFSRTLSIENDCLAVGSLYNTGYIYEWNGSTWNETILHSVPSYAATDGNQVFFGNALFESVDDVWERTIVDIFEGGTRYLDIDGDRIVYNGTSGALVAEWSGTDWEQTTLLAAPALLGFGNTIDIEGDCIMVGEDGANAAHLYQWNGGTWDDTLFTASDSVEGIRFGSSVAIGEDMIVVGASYGQDDSALPTGCVYVYQWNGATWDETKITASDAGGGDFFGSSVAVDGRTIIVGAYGEDDPGGDSEGCAYVYQWNGEIWDEIKLIASDREDFDKFGFSVDIDGATAIVGSIGDDDNGDNSGSVYTYDLSAYLDLVAPGSPTGLSDLNLNGSVTLSWTNAVDNEGGNGIWRYIVEYADNSDFNNSTTVTTINNELVLNGVTAGGTYYWRVRAEDNSANKSDWEADNFYVAGNGQEKIVPGIQTAFDMFGQVVAMGDDFFATTSRMNNDGETSSDIHIFMRDGSNWNETVITVSEFPFSWSDYIDTCDNTIVVGERWTNQATLYQWDGSAWQETTLSATGAVTGDQYGWSVAVGEDIVAVGSRTNNSQGSVDVFNWNGSEWQECIITASDAAEGDYFGSTLAVNDGTIVVGAYGNDDNGDNSGSVYVYQWNGAEWDETKLTASDGATGDNFGMSVAIDNNTIVVGASGNDDDGDSSGSVYVYQWDGSAWQETIITAADAAEGDGFGRSVAIDNGYIVVGAQGNDTIYGDSSGSAYVYKWSGSEWIEYEFYAADLCDGSAFGFSVDINDDKIIVGSMSDEVPDNSGSAYVFDLDSIINSVIPETPAELTEIYHTANLTLDWADSIGAQAYQVEYAIDSTFAYATSLITYSSDITLENVAVGSYYWRVRAVNNTGDMSDWSSGIFYSMPEGQYKFTAFDEVENNYFGWSVGVDGDTVVVGVRNTASNDAYIYRWSEDQWVETKIHISENMAGWGRNVDINGDIVVVGDRVSNTAHVYQWNGSDWIETILTASDGSGSDQFGWAAAVDTGIIAAGAVFNMGKGAVYVYQQVEGSWQETKLTASDGSDNDTFGKAVAVDGQTVIVGSMLDDDNGESSGSAYIYQWNGASWQETKLTASDGSANDFYGYSVAIDGDVAVVGAYGDVDGDFYSGSAYIYRWNGVSWQETKLTASDGIGGAFGWSVAIDGDTVAIGAKGNNDGAGGVYIYRWNGVSWYENKITAVDGEAMDHFGASVAIDGNSLIVGAGDDDSTDGAVDTGAAYFYELDTIIDIVAPDTPENLSSTIVDDNATLDWGDAYDNLDGVGFNRYEIEYADNAEFSNSIILFTISRGINLNGLNISGTYYWRVRTVDNNGNISEWSTTDSFIIDLPFTPVVSSGLSVSDEIVSDGTQVVLDGGTTTSNTIASSGWQMVSSGGSAIDTTVLFDGRQFISSGGLAAGTIVSNGGFQVVYSGGVANDTIANGGMQSIKNGYASGAIINAGGTQSLLSGGSADHAVVNDNAFQNILSGGTASGTIVNTYGSQHISSGGLAVGTILDSNGLQYVFSDGISSETTLNNGSQFISSGGTAINDTINHNGYQGVFGGTASGTEINSGGSQQVSGGGSVIEALVNYGGSQSIYGSAIANILNSGGLQQVYSNGLSNESILNGGSQSVYDNGTAINTIVNSDGLQTVFSSGTASGTEVNSGGSQLVSSGGVADGTIINSSGSQIIDSGGTASGTVINSNGYLLLTSGGIANSAVVNTGGTLEISGGSAVSSIINGGELTAAVGGVAIWASVNESGLMQITSGGSARNANINSGGRVNVESGGYFGGIINIDGGTVVTEHNIDIINGWERINLLDDAGLYNASFTLTGGAGVNIYGINNSVGSISISSDGALNFNISEIAAPNETVMLNDLTTITASNFHLTIDSSANINGSYQLAANASAFTGSVTVFNLGTDLGELSFDNPLLNGDITCTLSVNESGILTVEIAADGEDILSPSTPDGLNTTVNGGTAILDWNISTDDRSGVSGYVIEYASNSQFFEAVSQTVTSSEFNLTGLYGETCYWRVKAVDNAGNESDWSESHFLFSMNPVKVTASDGTKNDWYGKSVGIAEDNVVVGAILDDDMGDGSGSAYVYRWNGNSYDEYKLTASDGSETDQFGGAVAISGDVIAVGAIQEDELGTNSGSAYAYRWNGSGYDEYKLTASDGAAYDYFGNSIGVSGNNIIVGAYLSNSSGPDAGSAYLYHWNGASYEEYKFTASDSIGFDYFGYSVAISGDNAVIGAHYDDDNGSNSGSAYVYRWEESAYQEYKLTASDAEAGDNFGYSVAIDGDNVAVGTFTTEKTYVYRWNGVSYDEFILTASDGAVNDHFGSSVGICGDNIVVGAYGNSDNGNSSGSIYIYHWNGTAYTGFKLNAPDGAAGDNLGGSVGISVDSVVVGAKYDDDNGDASGSAYVFDISVLEIPIDLSGAVDFDSAVLDWSDVADNLFGVKEYIVEFADNELFTDASCQTVTDSELNLLELADGIYYWHIKAVDNLDQESDWSSTDTFTITTPDTIAPDVPTGMTVVTISDNAALDWDDATDDKSGIREYIIEYADNDLFNDAVSQTVLISELELSGLAIDTYYWRVKTVDNAGNESEWSEINSFNYNIYTTETTKILAAAGSDGAMFGKSISAENGVFAISSIGGFSCIYEWDGETLNQTVLPAPGLYAATDGEKALLGNYIYELVDGTWTVTGRVDSTVGTRAADIDGDNVVFNASTGAFISHWNGTGWESTGLLLVSDLMMYSNTVDIDEDMILIGEDGADQAHLFELNGETWSDTVFTASDEVEGNRYGTSVAMDNDIIVIGASYARNEDNIVTGAVYVYQWNGVDWLETKITAADGASGDYFGSSVAVDGGTILVGAFGDDDNGNMSGCAYVYQWNGETWSETKLLASDGAEGDLFGYSVAVDGAQVMVGARDDDDNGDKSGSVYYYDLSEIIDIVAPVAPSDLTENILPESVTLDWSDSIDEADGSGFKRYVIEFSDNSEFIGAESFTTVNSELVIQNLTYGNYYWRVAAEDYNCNLSEWVEDEFSISSMLQAYLTASDAQDYEYFGWDVSIDADTVVIGTHGGTNDIYVYKWLGAEWQETKLHISDTIAGWSDYINLDNDLLVVGDRIQNRVCVFRWDGSEWQETILTASDGVKAQFGWSASVDGDIIVTSSRFDAMLGSAYIYQWNGSEWLETKLTASDAPEAGSPTDSYGWSTAVSGNTVVIGAYLDDDVGDDSGSAYVYQLSEGSWLETKLLATDGSGSDYFGWAVAADGDTVVVGARGDDDNGENSGSVYVYRWNDVSWVETKITASDGAEGDAFGWAVDIDGDYIAVGSRGDDDSGTDSGSVYIYHWNGYDWYETKITAPNGGAGDYFGSSIDLKDGMLVVGAYGDDDAAENAGGAYVFSLDTILDSIAPTTPGNLSAVVDEYSVSLDWDDATDENTGIKEYYVEYSLYNDFSDSVVIFSTSSDLALSNLNDTRTYYWRVAAVDANGNISEWSTADSFSIDVADTLPPEVPTDLSQAINASNVALDWADASDNKSGVMQYVVEYSRYRSFSSVITETVTSSELILENLDMDTWYWRVKTVDFAGNESEWANNIFSVMPEGQYKFIASDMVYGNFFGQTVAIDGNTVAVRAQMNDGQGNYSIDAYVYRWETDRWIESKIHVSDIIGGWGRSLDIAGNTMVTGDRIANQVHAYLWDGSYWQETILTASDGDADQFGWAVSTDDGQIVVGAHLNESKGAAYIYQWNGSDWLETKLTASDGSEGDSFGRSVAVVDDLIAVGAMGDDDLGASSGSAYIYGWNGSGWQETKLLASDGTAGDFFGGAIATDGNTVVVGAYGDDGNGLDSGSAYIYRWDGSTWLETQITASDGAEGDAFGWSVAVAGDYVVVGSRGDDDNGGNSGSVYVYRWNGSNWYETKITAFDGAVSNLFGFSVDIDNDMLVVGAYGDDDGNYNAGSTYLYDLNEILDFVAPENPGGLSDFVNADTASLTWSPATDNDSGISEYMIEYSVLNDFSNATTVISENTTLNLSSLADLTTYYWHVAAIDNNGNVSDWSVTDYFYIDLPDTRAPTAPGQLNQFVDGAYASLDWADSSDDKSGIKVYTVRYSQNTDFSGSSWRGNLTESNAALSGLTDGVWYWQVKAIDNAGNVSEWSQAGSFVIDLPDTEAPGIPSGLACDVDNDSVSFFWTESTDNKSGVAGYIIQYADNQAFAEATSLDVLTNTVGVDNFTDGTWYWRVMAVDNADNESAWTAANSFTVDVTDVEAPSTPVWTTIDVDAVNHVVTLDWADSTDNKPGTIQYEVALTTGSQSDPVYYYTTESLLAIDDLPVNTYSWNVTAIDAAGNESAAFNGDDFEISDNTPPSEPIAQIDSISGDDVYFSWYGAQDYSGISHYIVEYADNSGFVNPVSQIVYGTTFELLDLPDMTTWYWHVKAVDYYGNGSAWGTDALIFSIDLPDAQAPSVPSGLTDEVIGTGAAFSWSPSTDNKSGVCEYIVQYSQDAGFSSFNYIAGSETSVATIDLAEGVWYWRVKVIDNADNVSDWSLTENFTVDTIPDVLPVDVNGAYAYLAWNQPENTSHIDHYRVTMSNNADLTEGTTYDVIGNNFDFESPSAGRGYFTVEAVYDNGTTGHASETGTYVLVSSLEDLILQASLNSEMYQDWTQLTAFPTSGVTIEVGKVSFTSNEFELKYLCSPDENQLYLAGDFKLTTNVFDLSVTIPEESCLEFILDTENNIIARNLDCKFTADSLTVGSRDLTAVSINIDTANNIYEFNATANIMSLDLGVSADIVNSTINTVTATHEAVDIQVGVTGMYLHNINAEASDLSGDSVNYNGNVSLYHGFEYNGANLLELDLDADIGIFNCAGESEISLLEGVATGTGDIDLDWNIGILTLDTGFNFCEGAIITSPTEMKVDASGNLSFRSDAVVDVTIDDPDFSMTMSFSGQSYCVISNDGDNSNDYIAAWVIINDSGFGVKYYFNGTTGHNGWTMIGGQEIESLAAPESYSPPLYFAAAAPLAYHDSESWNIGEGEGTVLFSIDWGDEFEDVTITLSARMARYIPSMTLPPPAICILYPNCPATTAW